jgi:hypothetical protein
MHPCPLSDPKTDRFSGWSEEAGRVEHRRTAVRGAEKLRRREKVFRGWQVVYL